MKDTARQSARDEAQVAARRKPSTSAEQIAQLQRTLGNRALGELLEGGQSLDPNVRNPLETSFQTSFQDVRVHTGPAAEASARELHAAAYTVGSDIVFGPGRFSPQTPRGRAVLAHELAHVIQQRHAQPGAPPVLSNQGEAEARQASGRVMQGFTAGSLSSIPSRAIQRLGEKESPANRTPLSDAEIARLDEAALEKRLRQNDEEARGFLVGVHSPAYEEQLRHEHDALWAALNRQKQGPRATPVPTPPPPPADVQTLSTEELYNERARVHTDISKSAENSSDRPKLQARADLLDKEFNTRREIYEKRLRDELPSMTKAMDERMSVGRTGMPYKPHTYVDSMTVEGYGAQEFQIFALGHRRRYAGGGFPRIEETHWKISLGVINFVTGQAKPASYVEHRGGAESEGLGPIDYIIDIASGIGAIRSLVRLALKPIIRGSARAFTTAAERALGRELAKDVTREVGAEGESAGSALRKAAGKGAGAPGLDPPAPKDLSAPKAEGLPQPAPEAPLEGSAPKFTERPPVKAAAARPQPDVATPKTAVPPPKAAEPAPKPEPAPKAEPAPKTAEPPAKPSASPHETDAPAVEKPKAEADKPGQADKPHEPAKTPASDPAAEAAKIREQRLAHLAKERSDLQSQIAEKKVELGKKSGRVAQLAGEIPKARGAQRERLIAERVQAEAERDLVRDDLTRLSTRDGLMQTEMQALKSTPVGSPQADGRAFELRNSRYSGMPKNNQKFDTNYPDASSPTGKRIPDHLVKGDGKGNWITSESPGDADFVADSKLIAQDGGVGLTPQIKGFIEIAAKTRQKVLMLITRPGTKIGDSVFEFARLNKVQVFQATVPAPY